MLYRLSLPNPSPLTADTEPYKHNYLPATTRTITIPTPQPPNPTNQQPHTTRAPWPMPPLSPSTTNHQSPTNNSNRRNRPPSSSDSSPSPSPQRIRRVGPRFALQHHRPFSSPPPNISPPRPQRPAPTRASIILQQLFGSAFSGNPPPLSPSRKGLPRSLRRPRQATSWVGEEAVRSAIFDSKPIRYKRRRDATRRDAADQRPLPPQVRFCPPSAAEPSGVG